MNQHSIQEAYLKRFCHNGQLWEHNVKTKLAVRKSAKYCTTETDFQPEYLEKMQNATIESPGIKAINKLIDGGTISQEEYDLLSKWIALHIIRNQRYRYTPQIDYNSFYEKLVDIEIKFANYFKYALLYVCPNEEYFVTSDNPVSEFSIGETIVRTIPISSKKLILLSSVNQLIEHSKLTISELVNSILWANSFRNVYSDRKNLPYATYEKNIVEFNLVAVFEESKFIYNERGLEK